MLFTSATSVFLWTSFLTVALHVSDSMHSNNTDDVAVLYERRWTYRRYRVDIFGKF